MVDYVKYCREQADETFYDPLKEAWTMVGDHIEKLEAKNKQNEAKIKKLQTGLWSIIEMCDNGRRRSPSFCSEPEGYCTCNAAFNAIEYDWSCIDV